MATRSDHPSSSNRLPYRQRGICGGSIPEPLQHNPREDMVARIARRCFHVTSDGEVRGMEWEAGDPEGGSIAIEEVLSEQYLE